jgi:xanthine dehydrogenase accessory factor
VLKAAREALLDGEPRMVSVQPENLLAELGVKAGRSSRGHPLRQQHVSEQGHHGYLRRAGAAASLAGDLRRKPVAMSLAAQAASSAIT